MICCAASAGLAVACRQRTQAARRCGAPAARSLEQKPGDRHNGKRSRRNPVLTLRNLQVRQQSKVALVAR